jgi:hypothetical protein
LGLVPPQEGTGGASGEGGTDSQGSTGDPEDDANTAKRAEAVRAAEAEATEAERKFQTELEQYRAQDPEKAREEYFAGQRARQRVDELNGHYEPLLEFIRLGQWIDRFLGAQSGGQLAEATQAEYDAAVSAELAKVPNSIAGEAQSGHVA